MKLLFDENLSPRLSKSLAGIYPGSIHVHECGLGSADDALVWEYAKSNGLAIVTKDSDFQDRSVLYGHPPKIVWLRVENCSSAEVENLLRISLATIESFMLEDVTSFLTLGSRRPPASSKRKSGKT